MLSAITFYFIILQIYPVLSNEKKAAILEKKYLMSSASIMCHLATGASKHKDNDKPPAEIYNEISSLIENVAENPKKPTPLNLYLRFRKESFKSSRPYLKDDEIVTLCSINYLNLSEEKKIKWIFQALDKEPLYKVLNL